MSNLLSKLFDAQKEMPSIQKNAINPHFKNTYVSLDGVLEIVLPVLHDRGLLLMQSPTNVDGQPALETAIYDVESGEDVRSVMMLVLGKDDPQGQGSALTYAKRYAILSILGLTADEDDDGAKAKPVKKVSKVAKQQLADVKDQAESSVPQF